MKQRLADYVADFLANKGITDCFTVVGGGAMHLNDAFGHHAKIHCTYNHHEQASAIAAEAYARLNNKIAVVCVTTGPGGTNAITGVLGAWVDSIPMLIISGQVRYDTTARYNEQFTNGNKLRAVGDQEFDITKSVECMTKYCTMIENPKQIRFALEKAYHLATTGRPGPAWIDIPVNFQGATIETDDLPCYYGTDAQKQDDALCPPKIDDDTIDAVLAKIRSAKRPVLYAGNGIRLANAYNEFLQAVDLLGIPVCTYWDSIDLIQTENPLYVGRAGNMGDRAGNFAVQNADVVLAVGNRLPIRAVGYNWDTWAREAHVIMVDIDRAELCKKTLHVEMPIWADAKDFFAKLIERAKINLAGTNSVLAKTAPQTNPPVFNGTDADKWRAICQNWKKIYPVCLLRHKEQKELANAYAVFDAISRALPQGTVTVTSNGTCCVAGHQTWFIKDGSRFFNNNGVASMGYGLPASIGACIAQMRQNANFASCQDFSCVKTICLEGDGSIMMNLQELQTIATNKLPIKIVLINNDGYHSIRQTQNNLFKNHCKVGIGPESKDLSFPQFKKIADAFDISYFCAKTNAQVDDVLQDFLSSDEPAILEIFVSTTQNFEPKSSARRLEDGTLVSPPLEDLAPFLPREELLQNIFIKPLEK